MAILVICHGCGSALLLTLGVPYSIKAKEGFFKLKRNSIIMRDRVPCLQGYIPINCVTVSLSARPKPRILVDHVIFMLTPRMATNL